MLAKAFLSLPLSANGEGERRPYYIPLTPEWGVRSASITAVVIPPYWTNVTGLIWVNGVGVTVSMALAWDSGRVEGWGSRFGWVWGQAARGVSSQQAILKVLAAYPDGLMSEQLRIKLAELFRESGLATLEEKQLEDALETLKRHDVIQQNGEFLQIIVELFRRWVLNQ